MDLFNIISVYTSVNLSLVTSGVYSLTSNLNLPDDMIVEMKAAILPDLRNMRVTEDVNPTSPLDIHKTR